MGYLRYGMRGDYVRDVQGLLYQAGLYDGMIDGRFGNKTEQAVKNWQNEIGVLSDGYWGIKTIEGSADYLAKFNTPDSVTNPVIPFMKGKYE
jgi:N-acetylmuramoyl-L-alanine amidase